MAEQLWAARAPAAPSTAYELDALERLRTRGFQRSDVRVVFVGAMQSQEVFAWQSGIDTDPAVVPAE